MRLLRDLARRRGISVLVSTHDLDLALRLADEVWLASSSGEFYQGRRRNSFCRVTLRAFSRARHCASMRPKGRSASTGPAVREPPSKATI